MKIPAVVDLPTVQQLSKVLRKADLHKIRSGLLNCLPSLAKMPNFFNLTDKMKASLPPMELLSSLPDWHILELLNKYMPGHFSHTSTQADDCVLHSVIAPLVTQSITRWPFFVFLGGAMFCLLASSSCHLLSCHSERLSYIMLRLDYAGIAVLISTSFYPPVYYSFMCDPFFCNLYLGVITLFGIVTTIFSLLPSFQSPEFRSFRASLFFGMGMSGAVPVLHKLILFWNRPEALQTTGYEVLMGALYGLGALIYAVRIPERWKPGRFDIAGQSHQLFHVLVVAGAFTHYHAGVIYLKWRDFEGCS